MEVYAGYSENADYNVGRVIDAIEELGELDNTLVLTSERRFGSTSNLYCAIT